MHFIFPSQLKEGSAEEYIWLEWERSSPVLFAYVCTLSFLYFVKISHCKVFVKEEKLSPGPQVSLQTTGEIGLEYESSIFNYILL